MSLIGDLRGLADNPDVYGHAYPLALYQIADRLESLNPLVPVPVGEPVTLYESKTTYIQHDGRVYQESECGEWYTVSTPFGLLVLDDDDAVVQPVRLVPLCELPEGVLAGMDRGAGAPVSSADLYAVGLELRQCALAWEPDVRLLGNIRAADLAAMAREYLDLKRVKREG